MSRESMMRKLGLTAEDFEPKPKNDEQDDTAERLEILEQAFAEFVAEVLEDG